MSHQQKLAHIVYRSCCRFHRRWTAGSRVRSFSATQAPASETVTAATPQGSSWVPGLLRNAGVRRVVRAGRMVALGVGCYQLGVMQGNEEVILDPEAFLASTQKLVLAQTFGATVQTLSEDSPTTRKVKMVFQRVLTAARSVAREMQNEENEGSYSHKGVECTEKGITSVLRENWRVVVVSSPVPNAFVVPTIPRTVFVSKGLVHAMGSDAGLAYVLAHELAHVLAAHGNQQIASKLLARIGQLLILALIDSSGVLVGAAEVVAYGLGKYGFELPVQRGNEMEADKLAIHINARACYSPSSGPSALKRLHEVGGVGGWAHTHPTTVQRLEQLENEKHSAGEHYDEGCKQIADMWLKSYRYAVPFPGIGRTLHQRRLEQESRKLWDHIDQESDNAPIPDRATDIGDMED